MASKGEGLAPAPRRLAERDQQIWVKRVRGASLADLASEYKISVTRVHQILREVATSIPPNDVGHLKSVALEIHDRIRSDLFDLAGKPPAPSFAPNGKELLDRDGEPIPDYKLRLSSYEILLKELTLWQRLTGVDAPQQHQVVEEADKAKQATERAAEKVAAQFAGLLRSA